MKKLVSVLLILLVLPGVVALSIGDLSKAAGTPPDAFFYKVDRIIEKVQLALARGEESVAKVRLGLARERLGEFKVMVDKGRTEQAEIALEEYLLNIKYARAFSFRSDQDFKDLFDSEAEINVEFFKIFEEELPENFKEGVAEAMKASKIVRTRFNMDESSPFKMPGGVGDGISDAVKKLLAETGSDGNGEEVVEITETSETEEEVETGMSDAVKAMLESSEEETTESEETEQETEETTEEQQETTTGSSDTLGYVEPNPAQGYH